MINFLVHEPERVKVEHSPMVGKIIFVKDHGCLGLAQKKLGSCHAAMYLSMSIYKWHELQQRDRSEELGLFYYKIPI